MTRPRARPKPGRYWVVQDGEAVYTAADTREEAIEFGAWRDRVYPYSGPHRIIECVPMPRVTFRRLPENEDAWEKFVVSVNGVDVIWFDFAMDAHRVARDLRRALRGK